MANYYCSTRTNYFRVKDEDAFRRLIGLANADEDECVQIHDHAAKDGTKLFCFGAYGTIGLPVNVDEEVCNENDEDFLYYSASALNERLQEVVADDDAIIIMEAGGEKLRYVVGEATVITRDAIKTVDMTREAVKLAQEMLGNPGYAPKTSY